jgi:PAS domain S-box-containing protein
MLVGGKLAGILNVNSTQQRRPFTLGQMKALSILASTAASALESAQLCAQLYEAEQKYRLLVDTANETIVVTQDGMLKFVNPETVELTGYSEEELTSIPFVHFIHPDDKEMVLNNHFKRLRGETLPDVYPFRIVCKDSRTKYVEISNVLTTWEGRPATLNFISDITERKLAEEDLQIYQEQLQSLASQLSLTEERERRRIATELHDHIGQTLALCKIKLGTLRGSAISPLAESLDEIRNLIEQTIQYTRSLTFELSPPILYELGFEAAVEWLGEQILKKHGINFCFENDGHKPLNDESRVLLFQTVRELLVNVAKHAQARNTEVSIQRDGDNIRIDVEDDGVGFDTSKFDYYLRRGGFGLFSIRERLRHLGGHIEMKSEPGHGTQVTVVTPLKLEK